MNSSTTTKDYAARSNDTRRTGVAKNTQSHTHSQTITKSAKTGRSRPSSRSATSEKKSTAKHAKREGKRASAKPAKVSVAALIKGRNALKTVSRSAARTPAGERGRRTGGSRPMTVMQRHTGIADLTRPAFTALAPAGNKALLYDASRSGKRSGPFETLGHTLGGTAGRYFDTILGQGAYKVHHNSVYQAAMRGVDFMHSNQEGIRICKREFLGFVYSSTEESSQRYVINPGVPGTHPVISRFASSYDLFDYYGLVFEYRPIASAYSTSGGLGYVAMATQYDSSDEPYASAPALLNSEFATSCSPAEYMAHPVECSPAQSPTTWRFVRHSETDATEDDRLTDWGVLTVLVGGQQTGGVAIGELWATSDVGFERLKTPEDNGVGRHTVLHSSYYGTSTDLQTDVGMNFDPFAPDEYSYGVALTYGRNLDPNLPTASRYALEEPGVYRVSVALQFYDPTADATKDILQIIGAADMYLNVGQSAAWHGGGVELIRTETSDDGQSMWISPINNKFGVNMPVGEGSLSGATVGNSSSSAGIDCTYRTNVTYTTASDLTKNVSVEFYVRTRGNFTRSTATLGNAWIAPMEFFAVSSPLSSCVYNATFTITKVPSAMFQYPITANSQEARLERLERLLSDGSRQCTDNARSSAEESDDSDDAAEVKQALYERLAVASDPIEVAGLQRQLRSLA